MKDFCRIAQEIYAKTYYNKNNQYHRLTGPAVEWLDGNKWYYINNFRYMEFYKNYNELYIFHIVLKLTSKYEENIKQNIKDLIEEYNSKIILNGFNKEEINQFPNWLKYLIIL